MRNARVVIAAMALMAGATAAKATLSSTPIWTLDGTQDNDRLGYSVGTAGDVNGDGYSDVIVGEPNYQTPFPIEKGRVRVFHGGPGGVDLTADWTRTGTTGSTFGQSVASAGDVNGDGYDDVLVGAPRYTNGESNEGAAYLYLGSASGLSTTPAFSAEGGQADMRYGWCVATAGDVNFDGFDDVVIGAPGFTNTLATQGRAYVYLGNATGVNPVAHLRRDGLAAGDNFGSSVSSAGDVNGDRYADIVVGAYLRGSGSPNDYGAAYGFHGSASGVDSGIDWSVFGTEEDEFLGFSVSLAGDLNGDGYSDVLVGAHGFDTAGGFSGGHALAYAGSATGLSTTPLWTRFWTEDNGSFGWCVGTAGDVNGDGYADLAVGAPGVTTGGMVEMHYGTPSGPSFNIPAELLLASSNANFGFSVQTAGDIDGDGFSDMIVGAPYYDGAGADRGRVQIFKGGPDSYGLPAFVGGLTQTDNGSGSSVAYADVNGDGYSDLIGGASLYDAGGSSSGAAFCWNGGPDGIANPVDWSVTGNQNLELLGSVVANAGDVNGDGYDDVAVTAPLHDGVNVDGGRGDIYLGSSSGLSLTPSWSQDFGQDAAHFGSSAASAGDVNGDGYGDVIWGVPGRTNPQSGEGAVWLYLGGPTGLSTTLFTGWEGNQAGAQAGYSVACAGDVNGDGYDDILSGSPRFSDGETGEGVVFVFFGGPGELPLGYSQLLQRNQPGAHFGSSVASAGDVNGDGYSDVIVGSADLSNGQTLEGGAALFLGSPTGLEATPFFTYESNEVSAHAGTWVGSVGDVNADGYSDFGIGVPNAGATDAGSIKVFAGSPTAITLLWSGTGSYTNGHFGERFTGAGDVDADGYPDLVTGSPDEDGGNGKISVYQGNSMAFVTSSGGPDIVLAQYRAGFAGPVALRGQTNSQDTFNLGVWLRSAYGRRRVQLEHSVVPLGTDWTPYATSPEWYDTGAPAAGEGSRVRWVGVWSDMQAGTPYHWRFRTRTDSPFFPRTPWFSLAGNAPTEADLRTQQNVSDVADTYSEGMIRIESVAPQPVQGPAIVRFALGASGPVTLAIHDVSGRRVVTVVEGLLEAGEHAVTWDGLGANRAPLASGVYFARLDANGETSSARVVVTR